MFIIGAGYNYVDLRMARKKKQTDSLRKSPVIDINISRSFTIVDGLPCQNTKNPESEILGRHFIVDFWGAKFLDDVDIVEQALKDAADAAEAILLHIHIHKFSQGGGVTGVALLAESHISIHSWPERNYAAFDVFMCGNSKPEKAVELLESVFQPDRFDVNEVLRGKF